MLAIAADQMKRLDTGTLNNANIQMRNAKKNRIDAHFCVENGIFTDTINCRIMIAFQHKKTTPSQAIE